MWLICSTDFGTAAVPDGALKKLGQELWDSDVNNAIGTFKVEKQGRTTFGSNADKAPGQ